MRFSTAANPFTGYTWITFTGAGIWGGTFYMGADTRSNSLTINSPNNVVYIGGYIVGGEETNNFPIVSGTSYYDNPSANHGTCALNGDDGFIQGFDKTDGTLLYGTFYGGTNHEALFDIDYDIANNYLVAVGKTGSENCPTCPNNNFPIADATAYEPIINNGNGNFQCVGMGGDAYDGFIVSFDESLTTRIFGSYYGGEVTDQLLTVTIDQSNSNIFVAGNTSSSTGIVTTASTVFQNTNSTPKSYAYIGSFDASGNYITSTYFGTGDGDFPFSIILTPQNEIAISGEIYSGTTSGLVFNGQPYCFPAVSVLNTGCSSFPGFIASLHYDLSDRYWSTCFGGNTSINKIINGCSNSIVGTGSTTSGFYDCESSSAPTAGAFLFSINSTISGSPGCSLNWTKTAGCPNDFNYGVAFSPSGIYGACGATFQNNNCQGPQIIYLGGGLYLIVTQAQPSYSRYIESYLAMTVNITPNTSAPYEYCGTSFDLDGSVTIGGANSSCPYEYQWYLNGVPIAGATNSTYSVLQAGSYSLKVITNCGSAFSNQFLVTPCCTNVTYDHSYSSSQTFNNYTSQDETINFGSGGANTVYTFTGNNLFEGSEVTLGPNVKIKLAAGATLTIKESPTGNFSYWHACEHFWKGIYADDASTVVTITSGATSGVGRTIISDASNALVLENGTEFHIDQCDFVNNYIGMLLHLYNGTNYPNCSIYDVSFYGTGQLIQTSLSPNNAFIPQTSGTSLTLPACGIALWRVFDPLGTLAAPIMNIGDFTYSNGIVDFNKLHYGILNYQSSANVQHCKFSNLNSQSLPFSLPGLGGSFDQSCGIVINGAGNIPLFNVIGDGSIAGSNTFDHCITGIELIKYNGLTCDILSNTMTDIYQYGIRGVGCLRCIFNFNTNDISIVPVTGTMTPYQSVSAITVYESDQIYSNCIKNKIYGYNFPNILGECRGINLVNQNTGESSVLNNEAYNVSAGIHVVHSTSPLIDYNIIYFTDAPNCSTCVVTEPRGISVVDCPNGSSSISGTLRPEITNNTVVANTIPSIYWGLNARGIFVQECPEYLVFNNFVSNQNVVNGICDISVGSSPNGNIVCNTFKDWDKAAVRVSQNPSGDIGPITTSGSTSGCATCEASGNVFLGPYQVNANPRLNTFNATNGNNIYWYYDNSGTTDWRPFATTGAPAILTNLIGTNNSADCSPPIPMIAGGEGGRTQSMHETVYDSLTTGISNQELQSIINYHANNYTFNSLYSDSTLIEAGSNDDWKYASYFDSVYATSTGLFRRYAQALKDTDYVTAQNLLNEISESDVRIYNEKVVSQIELNFFNRLKDTLDTNDTLTISERNILWEIAQQNSLISGKGVHKARALLNLIMDDPELPANRFEDNLTGASLNQITVYPNPNDGLFTVASNNFINEVKITDILGRIISVISVSENAKKININLSELSSGVYLILVSDEAVNNKTFKVVIAK